MRIVHAALAGAIILATASAVVAAELPSRRAAERPAAKSCAAYGAGFVWAPAVNSCVRVGGGVAVEYSASPRGGARLR